MEEFLKLRLWVEDSDEGQNTVLYIKGFSGPLEIQHFIDSLYEKGILTPKVIYIKENTDDQ